MMRVLIPYGTSDGHTARIAEYLADVIRAEGHEAFPVDVRLAGAPGPEDYDAVLVGASVRMGKHQRRVRDYVRRNHAALERCPSAFFSVSLAAHDAGEAARKEVAGYIESFVQETGWRPGKVGLFAGALLYTRYGLFTRWIMKRIARGKGSPDLDTSRDYVYTDWNGVTRFAEEFLQAALRREDAGTALAAAGAGK